jgi:hypothetical protein
VGSEEPCARRNRKLTEEDERIALSPRGEPGVAIHLVPVVDDQDPVQVCVLRLIQGRARIARPILLITRGNIEIDEQAELLSGTGDSADAQHL